MINYDKPIKELEPNELPKLDLSINSSKTPCWTCKHWKGPGRFTMCEAFDIIPDEILSGNNRHKILIGKEKVVYERGG